METDMAATKNKPYTTYAVAILQRLYIDGKPEMEEMAQIERDNAEIASKIYQLRKSAKLTQQALAKKIRTSPSVISRLEAADYDGHSLSMLRRIAAALGKEVRISFIAARPVAVAKRAGTFSLGRTAKAASKRVKKKRSLST